MSKVNERQMEKVESSNGDPVIIRTKVKVGKTLVIGLQSVWYRCPTRDEVDDVLRKHHEKCVQLGWKQK